MGKVFHSWTPTFLAIVCFTPIAVVEPEADSYLAVAYFAFNAVCSWIGVEVKPVHSVVVAAIGVALLN